MLKDKLAYSSKENTKDFAKKKILENSKGFASSSNLHERIGGHNIWCNCIHIIQVFSIVKTSTLFMIVIDQDQIN